MFLSCAMGTLSPGKPIQIINLEKMCFLQHCKEGVFILIDTQHLYLTPSENICYSFKLIVQSKMEKNLYCH